jgi:glycosyltransferase involved in cell wall biosynthesis
VRVAEQRLRIAFVITSTGVGGAERQVYELARALRSRGHGVGVISMLPMHEQFLPLQDYGIRLASLEMTKGIADPRALVRLARLISAWRPDVVHGHMVHANLLTRLCRLLVPGPRVISTMHNQDEGAQWRYLAYRLTDPLADVTTTVSPVAVEEAIRRHAVSRADVVLVPNGLDTRMHAADVALRAATRASFGLGERFTWLAVGRLVEAKRHLDLIEAMRKVCQTAPDTCLLIAGDGPLRPSLQAAIRAAGLTSSISLLGLRDDVRALMQAADAFVLSSAWEGLPMVLLEAAASSLPIVTTDVGGSREVVVDGRTGFLAPAGQPAELAHQMSRLVRLNAEERRSMGGRARKHVRAAFDLERIVDRWETLYQSR